MLKLARRLRGVHVPSVNGACRRRESGRQDEKATGKEVRQAPLARAVNFMNPHAGMLGVGERSVGASGIRALAHMVSALLKSVGFCLSRAAPNAPLMGVPPCPP